MKVRHSRVDRLAARIGTMPIHEAGRREAYDHFVHADDAAARIIDGAVRIRVFVAAMRRATRLRERRAG